MISALCYNYTSYKIAKKIYVLQEHALFSEVVKGNDVFNFTNPND
jgi:hypothetical protein